MIGNTVTKMFVVLMQVFCIITYTIYFINNIEVKLNIRKNLEAKLST